MSSPGVYRFMNAMIAGAVFLIFSGCAAEYPGYENDGGRARYDQYTDRPGYYDFGRPVIFAPVEQNVTE